MKTVNFINNDGKEVSCEVLGMYDSEKTKKKYIIYTDNSYDKNIRNVYASEMIEEDNTISLKDISDNADKIIIEKMVESLGNNNE